ncbi:MAG: DUF2142 domain-containing protein [Bulleidia sp.]
MKRCVIDNKSELVLFAGAFLLATGVIWLLDNPLYTVMVISILPMLLFMIYCYQRNRWKKVKNWMKSRKSLFLYFLTVISVIVVLRVYMVYGLADQYGRVSFLLAVYLSYMLLITCFGLFFGNWKTEKVFLSLGISGGVFLMGNLPLRAAPDETMHMYTVYHISDQILQLSESQSTVLQMRETDLDIFKDNIEYGCNRQVMNDYYASATKKSDYRTVEVHIDVLQGSEIAYFLPACAISISRVLHLNGFWTFMTGRIINLVQYLLLIYISIKRIPFCKMIPFVIALLPMSLQLGMSYSYDSLMISGSIYVVSLSLNEFYRDKEKKRNCSEYWSMAGLLIMSLVMIMIKSHAYFMIGLFPLYLLFQKRYSMKKFWKWLAGFACILCLIFALYVVFDALYGVPELFSEPANPLAWAGGEQGYTLVHLLNNPLDGFMVFVNTLIRNAGEYLSTLIGRQLGWLNIPVSRIAIILYGAIMLFTFMNADKGEYSVQYGINLYCLLTIIVTILGIFLALLVLWTPISSPVILGLQGRYFLQLVMFAGILFQKKSINISDDLSIVVCGECLGMILVASSLLFRM